jgi:DNA-binding SARP family transcriptional activator/tetratricopeptide (TPR) repeat protein
MDFRILGPLEVLDEGGAVALGGSKQRALLALLLLHANETLTTDRLIDELWGERAPASAVKAVQVRVSRLRKALEGESGNGGVGVVETREHGYRLHIDPDSLDAHRFERLIAEGRSELAAGRPKRAASMLETALSLWRGAPLTDLAYEQFAQLEIGRLNDMRVAALEQLVEAKLAVGSHAEVVGQLEPLIAEYPYRERLRAQFMIALYRGDRQADALQAYQDARKQLVDELGIEPGERLRKLEQAILAQDPALAITADAPAEIEPVAETPRSAFVGRGAELAELVGGVDDAFAGRGRLFVVVGEPGIGKSRLAEELIVHARARGALVLVGRCWEAGGAPAYWPWVQSLRAFLRESDTARLRSQLGAGAADLAQILPELRTHLPELPEPPSPDSEGARFRLFEATAELLRNASESRPIVLVLDDLHAADVSSLLLLRFLARQLGSARLLLLGAYRNVDPLPGAALNEMLAEVAREPVADRISLDGLSEQQVAEYIELTASDLASPELIKALHQETEGNPLFVGEMVRLLSAEGMRSESTADIPLAIPQTVRAVIARRLTHLSEECNRVLEIASVLGREFALDALARVGGVSEDELLQVLDEAMAAHVVSDIPGAPGHLRFAHVLIRDTIYEGLTTARRVYTHRLVVKALEALYGRRPGAHLTELAHHSIAASEFDKGLAYAWRAADRALTLLAYEESARLYEMALGVLELRDREAEGERTIRLERLELGRSAAEAANLAGEHNHAATLIRAAALLVDPDAEPVLAGLLRERLGRYLWAAGNSEAALIAYEEAVALVPSDKPSAARARVLAAQGQALMLTAQYRKSRATCEEAIAMALEVGVRAEEGHALNTLALDLAYLGDAEAGISRLLEARQIAEEVGDLDDIGRAYLNLAELHLGAADRPGDALDVALTGVEAAHRLGLARDYGVSLQAIASTALFALGRWPEAEQILREAEEFHPDEVARTDLLQARVQLLVASGRSEAADDDLQQLRCLCERTVDLQYRAPLSARVAELALWRGDPDGALAAVAAGLGHVRGTDDSCFIGPLLSLGLRAAADDAERARSRHDPDACEIARVAGNALLEQARTLAADPPRPPAATLAHVALCEAEAARLAHEPAAERWRVAGSAWQALDRPYPAAYAGWREAEDLLIRSGRSTRAKVALLDAHRIARDLGAAPLQAQIELLAARWSVDFARAEQAAAPQDDAAKL